VIAGDDGCRYTFGRTDWLSDGVPQAGVRVDFESDGRCASAVYVDPPTPLTVMAPYDDFYRSSDENMIAGVCAGLAHKWQISRAGLRVATVLVALCFGISFFIYVVCWIVFPSVPTRRAVAQH